MFDIAKDGWKERSVICVLNKTWKPGPAAFLPQLAQPFMNSKNKGREGFDCKLDKALFLLTKTC
jgi:hypothetical protein